MTEDRTKNLIRDYSASLTPEQRSELARDLLEAQPSTALTLWRPVPVPILRLSRFACLGIVLYYWSMRSFAIETVLELALSLFFPVLVVSFPNQLSRATGHLGVSPKIRRVSPPRAVLALGWVILSLPILLALLR